MISATPRMTRGAAGNNPTTPGCRMATAHSSASAAGPSRDGRNPLMTGGDAIDGPRVDGGRRARRVGGSECTDSVDAVHRSNQPPSRRPGAGLRLLVAGLAIALGWIATGCNPTDTPISRAGGSCSVGVVGDSLTVGARDLGGLAARVSARGCTLVALDARKSRPTAEGASIVEGWASRGALPSILVVALGTNDCSTAAFVPAMNRILAAAGPDRPVVWVNSFRRGCDGAVNGPLLATQLRLGERPDKGNLWIVDNCSWLTARPGLLARDGVHLRDGGGYSQLADRIVAALG